MHDFFPWGQAGFKGQVVLQVMKEKFSLHGRAQPLPPFMPCLSPWRQPGCEGADGPVRVKEGVPSLLVQAGDSAKN